MTVAATVADLARRGQVRLLVLAAPEITAQFQPSDCHANVAKWVEAHPGHHAVAGWLITASCAVVLHSVVDTGAELLDITPRLGRNDHTLLSFIVWPHSIDGLPSQLIVQL